MPPLTKMEHQPFNKILDRASFHHRLESVSEVEKRDHSIDSVFMNEICLQNIIYIHSCFCPSLMSNKLMENVTDNQISYFISHKLQFFSYLDRHS